MENTGRVEEADEGPRISQQPPIATTPLLEQNRSSAMPPISINRRARRTLGLILLFVVVLLWTSSNFLASTIFADNSYSKPFLVTYLNSASFIFTLIPYIGGRVYRLNKTGKLKNIRSFRTFIRAIDTVDAEEETSPILTTDEVERTHPGLLGEQSEANPQERHVTTATSFTATSGQLGIRATAKLSLEFCIIWFVANYFAMACLQHTSVASTTILTSTSGVWTLIFGAIIGVEKFTPFKCIGVFTSLLGIILISRLDVSSAAGKDNGSFPIKSPGEVFLGNFMAGFSAILYGVYTTMMKKRVGDESRVDMRLFFGLVGIFNSIILFPGFLILDYIGNEPLAFPPTTRIFVIVLVNVIISFASDLCWAYALLLTSPVIVTIGLSLNIPLSLLGQIIIQGKYATIMYCLDATLVFCSFLIVNYETPT